MNVKIIEWGDHRLHIIRLEQNQALMASLAAALRDRDIRTGRVSGRGRLSRLTVMKSPAGDAVTVPCPADVLTMEGDVVREGGQSSVIVHVLVAMPDGTIAGGRVAEATAEALEVTVEESPLLPPRTVDAATGAPFADLAAEPRRDHASPRETIVDEAAEDSFPASDPPSFAGVPEDTRA